MRKNHYAFTAAILLTGSVFAQNGDALYDRALGKRVPKSEVQKDLWSKGMDLTTWNTFGGSQNYAPMGETAIGHYEWMVALANHEKQEGVFGREINSAQFYFSMVLSAKLIALRDARAKNDQAGVKILCEDIRATWALDVLTALPTRRTQVWASEGGLPIYTSTTPEGYNGLTCAVAGERWKHGAHNGHDDHGEYLAWALDYKPRVGVYKNLFKKEGLFQGMVGQIGNKNDYDATMDPEIFGITTADRLKLQQVVQGDVNAAQWAASVVAGHGGLFKDVKQRIRRTTDGSECIHFVSVNGNKPTQAATNLTNGGFWKSLSPSFGSGGTGCNGGYAVVVNGGIITASCDPGEGSTGMSMAEMSGNIMWEVEIAGSAVKFNGAPVSAAPPINFPTATADAGVTGITYVIDPGVKADTITPKATVKNFGSNTINLVYVSYEVDNGGSNITTWRGSLAPGATVNVTLWADTITKGKPHTVKAYTGSPNYLADGNAANNTSTVSIGPVVTQTLDAGINTIVSPVLNVTDDSITPVGKIKNFGQAALTSANISYKINNGTPVTKAWTGNLAAGASVNYTFPRVPIAPGTYTIQVYTANPNAGTDGNTANDSKSFVFNVSLSMITDVEAISVSEPLALGCATNIQPQMVIQNNGPVTLDQVTINYRVDAGAVVSRTYSVATGTGLQTGKAMALHGNASTVTTGVHNLEMWSSVPNAVTDSDNSNDTITSAFTVGTAGQALPFTEDFESVTVGEVPSDWTRYNWDAFAGWFAYEYGTPTNEAMAFNNYAYTGAINTKDDLTMPILDLTGSSTAFLNFDLSHASRPAATAYDSLEVLISTDCGSTFTSVWGRGGTALNTVPDQASVFIPAGPADYQNVQVDLSAYTNSASAIIRFTNWSNNGNSTLIDNVNLTTSSVTPVDENVSIMSLNVFPNPATEQIQIACQLRQAGELKIKMMNSVGQIMDEVDHGMQHGYHVSRMEVNNYPAGIYNLLVFSGNDQVLAKKIVITH